MDEVDYANELADRFLQARLQEHANRLSHAVSAYPVGECRNCATKLDDGRPFCDSDCMQDWNLRFKANKRNGKYRGG